MERRLAAILAADVVGYSRLMGADETGTLAALQRHIDEVLKPKTAQHHGRLVKLMGDGALIEFASVVDAVTFAVDFQTAMRARNDGVAEDRRLVFRIGINLGDVVHNDGDIHGDGVNVAARLEGLAEPGGVCLSRSARDQVRDRLDLTLDDMGEVEVKNIARPVRAFRVLIDDKAAGLVSALAENAAPAPAAATSRARPLLAGAGVLAAAGVAALLWWLSGPAPAPSPAPAETAAAPAAEEHPSIAVLPFATMDGGDAQQYFAEGIAEDLITDLSQVSGLFVIARNSSFSYRDRSVDIARVALDLGARYVLSGSVRRSGDLMRINAQLTDASRGVQLWAERYDGAVADVFALQDEVNRRIVSALAVTLTPAEEKELNESAKVDPAAYDAYLQGQSLVAVYSPEANRSARAQFEQAITIDPSFGRAHAGLALTHAVDATFGWTKDPDMARDQAIKHARTALALNSTSPQVYYALAQVYGSQRKLEQGVTELRRAIALDPNFADGYVLMGMFMSYSGRPEEGMAAIRKAMQLSPRHGYVYPYGIAVAHFVQGDYDAAIPIIEDVLERNSNFQQGRLLLIAIFGLVGRIEDAEWEVEEVLAALPDFTIAAEAERVRFIRPEDLARYTEGLHKAGLPP